MSCIHRICSTFGCLRKKSNNFKLNKIVKKHIHCILIKTNPEYNQACHIDQGMKVWLFYIHTVD